MVLENNFEFISVALCLHLLYVWCCGFSENKLYCLFTHHLLPLKKALGMTCQIVNDSPYICLQSLSKTSWPVLSLPPQKNSVTGQNPEKLPHFMGRCVYITYHRNNVYGTYI